MTLFTRYLTLSTQTDFYAFNSINEDDFLLTATDNSTFTVINLHQNNKNIFNPVNIFDTCVKVLNFLSCLAWTQVRPKTMI